MKFLPILLCIAFIGCFASKPSAAEIENADYGAYPEDYKQIVSKWIFRSFYDPHSVRDLVITEPKKAHNSQWIIDGGDTIYGYSVGVALRAKNRMGGYTGLAYYYLLIRNGEIVFQGEMRR